MRIGTSWLVKLGQFDELIADRHRHTLSTAADVCEPLESATRTKFARNHFSAESAFVKSRQAICIVGGQTKPRESTNAENASFTYGHVIPRRFRNME